MRKVLFILIIFIAATTISLAQFYRVGSGFVISLPADNVKFGGGFEVFVEYKNESIFSFRTNGGFVITKFEDVNPYVSDIDYSLYWLDGSVILTPFKIIFEHISERELDIIFSQPKSLMKYPRQPEFIFPRS